MGLLVITLIYYVFLYLDKVQQVRGHVHNWSENGTADTTRTPSSKNDMNTQIECGLEQIIIRPGFYSKFDAEIRTYRVGDCFFDAANFDEIVILSQNIDPDLHVVNIATSYDIMKDNFKIVRIIIEELLGIIESPDREIGSFASTEILEVLNGTSNF